MSPLSLQACIADLPSAPVAIAVDPKGFKAALQSFIQFLVTHQVQATLWLKLPKDDAWWQDIWRYGQQAAGCTIYSLGEQMGNPPDTLAASLRPIPIEQTAELKREYLCLAVCDQFVGALLAARAVPGTVHSKRTIQLYSSASLSMATALSTGIKTIIESNLPSRVLEAKVTDAKSLEASLEAKSVENRSSEARSSETRSSEARSLEAKSLDAKTLESADEKEITGAAALSQWERLFPKALWTQTVLPLSETFWAWQMQAQADLRSQINERRSSETAAKPAKQTIDVDFLRQAREELQAPLTTIKTALTLLTSPTLKLTQRQRYMEMIAAQCDRQQTLINSITELLHIQTTQGKRPQPIELSEMLPGIVSTYQPIAKEHGIMLAYTIPSHTQTVLGLEPELKQVVIHLIKNSIHRTSQGGRVWVSVTPEGERFVALTVQDSGHSIPQSQINQLFKAFQSSGESNRATIELALVQPLVQKMGAHIAVESLPEHDTFFKVLLPVQSPVQSNPALSPQLAAACVS